MGRKIRTRTFVPPSCSSCTSWLIRATVPKRAIGRQIDATDRQIGRLVYELYELTDDEIRIVEESAR